MFDLLLKLRILASRSLPISFITKVKHCQGAHENSTKTNLIINKSQNTNRKCDQRQLMQISFFFIFFLWLAGKWSTSQRQKYKTTTRFSSVISDFPVACMAVLQHFKFSCKSRIKLKARGILIPGKEIIKNVIK